VASQQIVLGVERYGSYFGSHKTLHPELFSINRFFDLRQGDTFYQNLSEFSEYYDKAKPLFQDAIWVGDKIPRLYEQIGNLKRDVPNATYVMPLRNPTEVAMSYKVRQQKNEGYTWPADFGVAKAIEDWNKFVQFAYVNSKSQNFILLDYEDMYYSDSAVFEWLFERLRISFDESIIGTIRWMRNHAREIRQVRHDNLTVEEQTYIRSYAEVDIYENLRNASLNRM